MLKNDKVELPTNSWKEDEKNKTSKPNKPTIIEPLPESTRPRQDGPGGN